MTRLTDNTHPSHDFHPDDDVIACDACGCRTYNDEATRPCTEVSDGRPIKVEIFRFYVKQPDGEYATFVDAAVAAAYACDLNTAWYGEAENVETGEKWTRSRLLQVGYAMMDASEGENDDS